MKEELSEEIIKEFVELCPKIYSYKKRINEEENYQKEPKKSVIK